MKIIPLLRCSDLKEAVVFYTTVLDFTLKYPEEANDEWVIEIMNTDAEILLVSRDGTPRIAIYVMVDDIDAVFRKYVDRGLAVPNSPESPVHNSPIDQSWGMREFYVDDPFGNTLRFATAIG